MQKIESCEIAGGTMFDLDTTEETGAITALGRSLGMDVLFPLVKTSEQQRELPSAARHALFDSGLTIPVSTEFGGGGVPRCAAQMAAIEALSYGDAGLTLASAWSGAAATLIGQLGSPAQQAALLPRFATEVNAQGAVALYEGHGRAPSESTTTLTATGSDTWKLRGTKLAVPSADTSDPIIVIAVKADGSLCAVVVTPNTPGVTISEPDLGIALDATRMCAVQFDCDVTNDAILSGPSANEIHLAVSHVRLIVAAAALGSAQRSIDYAAKYANERIAFGKPISAFQGVSFLLAEAAIRIGAARVEMHEVADRIDDGDADNIEQRTTNAVNYITSVGAQATRDAMQVLGGHGFITDHPVEIWYRSTAALAALDFDPMCSAFEPSL
jgi:alkylation response protein AidB-like acyl-CoA dehydrogenase